MSARVQVLLAAVCFGTTGTAQALGPSASPVAVGAARIVLGGALLVAIARALKVRPPRLDATVLGIAIAIAIYQLSFFAAVKLTGVAVGTVVAIGTGPAAAGALGRLVNGERLTRRWALATACAAAGVVLLAGDGGGAVGPGGLALAGGAGVGHAAGGGLSSRLPRRGGAPEGVTAAGLGVAALLRVPVLPAPGPGFLTGGGGMALALSLAAIPAAFACVLFPRGLGGVTSGETATFVLAE